jgi:serine phosphatase RsbU (regulator of sigma subunit)
VEAARTATLVKDVLHAFSYHSLRPDKVMRRTNRLLVGRELPGFVTLFLGMLDRVSGELRYASAGHPVALLRRGCGAIEELQSRSAPLGVYDDAGWQPHAVELEADDVLLLYTDGVLEARREGELFGDKRLAGILARRDVPLDRLPHTVVDEVLDFSGGVLRDDVAVLALQLDVASGGGVAKRRYRQASLLE